jgi:cell wall-associated NlpC family hydrolase
MHSARRLAGVVLALAALGASTAVGLRGGGQEVAPDAAAAKVLAAAKQQLGDRYVWGGNGPDTWDCSGLTSVLWSTVGGVKAVPRVSRDQQRWAWPLRPADVRPGDLVFFGDPVTHVGIYAGDGTIVDASSSRRQVVERAIWSGEVVRYGRVPRAGVPHPAAPKAEQPAKPAPKPAPAPSPPPATTTHAASHFNPVPPAGHRPRTPTTKEATAFVAALRMRNGAGGYTAAGLVRWAWARAGFLPLPATPAGIEAHAKPVALRDLAVGDLVLYGKPAVHVGVYVGGGYMIDASRVLRKVSRRLVFASETVRFARLTPRRHG